MDGTNTALIKKNGLPPERLAAVEQGLTFFQTTAAERDALKKELDRMLQELAAARIENEGLRSQINTMDSRVIAYQLERDQAVARRAALETLFVSFGAQLRAFQFPTVPLITEDGMEPMHVPDPGH